MSLSMDAPRIMVFRPTLEEMKDFSGYIAYMESKGAQKAGVAKIIPPKEFVPRKDYSTVDLTIPAPIQQEVMGHKGLFTQFNIQKKALTFHEYKKLALSDKYKTPTHFDYEDLERKYWRNLAYNSPIYGADVSGSIFDKDWNIWNINNLGTVLDVIEEEQGVKIEGVNTAYLYFGMWKTTFAWHTEDMDLYSINYIHFGAPKTWYAIPPSHAKRLERLAAGFYPQNFQVCSNFLRHKMTVISPHILKKYSIPVNKITQESGEFMITFPYGYHSGFNHGFNCAESTNFASDRWIDYGKRARCCTCARDSVKINMDPFVRIFQPDRYEDWVMGKDFIHIEDIDGPMSDAQLEAKKEKKPSKKETALLKRKMAEIPNKPRRHPVHKRGELGDEVESPTKVKKKRGRMSSMAFSNLSEALASSSATSDDDILEIEVEIKGNDEPVPTINVKQELQKKLKEKSKKKAIKEEEPQVKTEKEKGAAKSPVKSQKSTPSKELQESKDEERKPVKVRTKRALEEEMMKGHEHANKTCKTEEQSDDDDNDAQEIKTEPVKREVKVSSEEVRTEHAYSSHPDTTAPSTSMSSEVVKKEKVHKDKKKSKHHHHHHHHHHSSSSSKHSKHHKSSSKEKDKEKEKVKKRERRGRGKHMKDFTPQEYATMKNWARSMFGLWVTQPNSFEMEQAYNASMADQKPGCCVCSLFYNDKIDSQDWATGDRAFSSSMNRVAGTEQDRRMVVLAPEYVFAASSENPNPHCANSLLSADGRSPILTCSVCMIAVHASCYGEANPPESGEWKCDRCQEGDFIAECCLCNLRGGALKLTNKDTWAHIVCAMAIPDVMFEDVEEREPINIDRISPARMKLKCFFCRTFIKNTPNNGACIQCSVGKCALSFHVTCAHAAGVIMEASDWPFSVYATCLRHPFPNRDMPRERPLRELKMKEKVIAKYKNNRYYKSLIVGHRNQLFYHVLFDDGTFSDNLFAQDIESHDCVHGVDPEKGEAVSVRWTDNELYNGKFVKSYYVKLYDVEFENESRITVKREDIYAKEEPLPKRVKTRFSHASDMQHEGFLENKVVPEKYRHLPNRGEGDDLLEEKPSTTESQKPSTSNTFLSFGELHTSSTMDGIKGEESKFSTSGSSRVDSDILVTLFKPEPPSISDSPFKVKAEPDLSVGAAIMNPVQVTPVKENSSLSNSSLSSPLRVKAESSPTSASSLSATSSAYVSQGQFIMSGGGDARVKMSPSHGGITQASPSKHNLTSGSHLNVPMTTSEAAEALAALTSMSSFPSSQRNLLPR